MVHLYILALNMFDDRIFRLKEPMLTIKVSMAILRLRYSVAKNPLFIYNFTYTV